jgi:hypothetical protein
MNASLPALSSDAMFMLLVTLVTMDLAPRFWLRYALGDDAF